MNFYDLNNKDSIAKDEIELLQQKQHELTLIKRELVHAGHTLFSFNVVTREIKVAPIERCKDVDFITRLPLHSPRLTIEPNCIYRWALNKKNVIKRLKREGYELS